MPSQATAKSSKLKLVDGLDKAFRRPCNWPRLLLRLALVFITTIPGCTIQQHLAAQEVARKAPPVSSDSSTPDLPVALQFVPEEGTLPLSMEADTESRYGDISRLEGNVVIVYRGHTIRADRISYDATTGDIIAEGHVSLTGGNNDESIQASHGTYNLDTQKGTFYDVNGSVGMLNAGKRVSYATANPFLFSGRIVVKTGPTNYDIYEGNVTSCLLPNPDWQLFSQHFSMDDDKARAYKSTFHLLSVPILFLPYVTHPTDASARQSGILIPVLSQSSTKGFIFGEEGYIVLGRSADLTVGVQYFTLRGFAESGTFRYRGSGSDLFNAHFSALQDRGFTPAGGVFTDQGGQDVTAAFRRQLAPNTRVVGDAEYLSSYVYREAFNENFNQAVSSDITSVLYAVNQQHGFSTDIRADRYQGLKRVPITTLDSKGALVTTPGQQVRIFHAPSIDFTAIDHRIPGTPFLWSLDSSASGLKRSQPNFISSGITERLDIRPELSLPLSGGGWHTLSSVAVRDTFYSRSRVATSVLPPVELTQTINRSSVEFQVDIRPPVIERDFHPPAFLANLLGPELRHTIEPELTYRDTRGIGNFLGVLRFDDVDVDSNTNELEYGVTQRLFARRAPAKKVKPCAVAQAAAAKSAAAAGTAAPEPELEPEDETEAPPALDANGIPTMDAPPAPARSHAHNASLCPPAEAPQHEWISWKLAQKRFMDPTFGGAVINTRRNVFDTTLSLSGIAFLTEARDISPLISRLRVRTSSHTDIEWDFDLDTGAKRFTSNNIFLDAHEGPIFGGISYARLNAPGRFFTETIDTNGVGSLTSSATSDFSQMRLLMGYGNSSKPGLSLAGNANLDLQHGNVQYLSAQTGYNWNCCGLSVEYRKYELGSVRNEGAYKFNFTLANIGTAGNLRKAERLF
jgi:LPS-assembly protein